MEFKRKPVDHSASTRLAISVERAIYDTVEVIAITEGCTLKEAASRLLEAGIAVYHAGKEQAIGDE